MNLGHLLSSVCSSGNFTVTQAGASLYEIIHFLWEPIFVANCWQSLTHWLPSWHYGTVTFCWPGSGCKSRLHYLSAKTLLTVCSLASSRLRWAESGLGADHGASSLITDMGPWSPHRGPCLHDSHRPGWHPAKTICSQSGEREKADVQPRKPL